VICDYGCGQDAKFQLKNEKWCCSDHWSHCINMKRKCSERNKGEKNPFYGRKHDQDTKVKIGSKNTGRIKTTEELRKLSLAFMGKNNPNFGKDHHGKNNPMFGKKHSEETKRKISERVDRLGEKNGMFAKKHTDSTKHKIGVKSRERMLNGLAAYANSFIKSPSKPQVLLFNLVKEINKTARLNYPILNYSADIAILDKKIVLEYDGSYWHQDTNKDLIRQQKIECLGWKVIRFLDRIPDKEELVEVLQ